MKNKYRLYFLILLAVMQFFAYTSIYAQSTAVYDYTQGGKNPVSSEIEKYLCAPTNQASNDLYNCINRIYRFAIILASVVAVFFIVIGGYVYMSAEGNQESVDKAKSILVSSITALVILMGGYVLLKALNPDLIKFKQIQPTSVKPLDTAGWNDWQSSKNLEGSGGGSKNLIKASGINGCNNCADYSQSPYNFAKNSTQYAGKNTFLNKALLDKLQIVKNSYPNFVINEAFPPTIDHGSACHFNGTCVDIGISNKSAAELDKLCQAAQGAGLTILNEYGSISASDFKVCPKPRTYGTTTGGHLHLQ